MTLKRKSIITGEIYHIYNKSINNEPIFKALKNLDMILEIVNYYRYQQKLRFSFFKKMKPSIQAEYYKKIELSQPLVEIYSYTFMPNHFHFLLKQLKDFGIKKFISNVQNSYAKYFNLINNREGSLFLNSFKFKRIKNQNEFLHVCRYIHLNQVTSRLIEFIDLENSLFSSYSSYLNQSLNKFINTKLINSYFKLKESFINFHKKQVNYQRKLKEIKDLLLD